MDQIVAQQQDVIGLCIAGLITAIVALIVLPLNEKGWDWRPKANDDPTCPLHKMPRSKCKPEWHE